MTYSTEFPGFPADAIPSLPEGFVDRSWHNDICPSFIHGESGIVLWIDHPDTTQREFEELPRFRAQRCVNRRSDAGWLFDGSEIDLFETDDWATAERSLHNFIAGVVA